MNIVRSVLALLAFAVPLAAQDPTNPVYQIHRDVVRGRVTTDSGRAVIGADVAVTMAPERNTLFAKTDSAARYEIVFEKGTGDYLVHIAAIGRQTFRKRVTRTGTDSVFTVDAVLRANVQQLATVQVQARRQRPARDQGGLRAPGVGGAEQTPSGVTAIIAPDQLGNLDAIASTLPGVSSVPGGGVSVLGLPPSQNNATLNGLAFDGGAVPRGARTTTRVATSTYDPARGGFSGAQTQVSLAPGNITTSRRAYVTFDAPQLQVADAVARRAGLTYTSVDLNLGTDGGTNMDRWMYNTGLQYKRQFADATSLLTADSQLLQHSGVARDSVARLLNTLVALGVPATVGDVPTSRVTDYVSFMGRLDRPLFDYSTFTPLNTTWGVTGYANFTRRSAVNFGPTVTAAHGGESRQINAGSQWIYSAYFGRLKDQLTEVRTGVSLSRSDADPYLRLPDGRVLTSSTFGDGTGGVASLGFAGNSGMESSNRNLTWQTTSETQFYWRGSALHRGKVYAESRLDNYRQDQAGNRLGSFSFNSLADLQANRPASFSRTLSLPSRSGGEWSGVLAMSDQWAKTPRFTLLYGARAEANVFTSAPTHNPQIATLFGARTDQAPNTWHVSPRVGFNWLSTTTARQAGTGMTLSGLGTFYSMARGVLRGGIGEFRQTLEPTLLADASTSTGLPNGTRRITCVGPAVPVPDWRAYAQSESSIPTMCADASFAPGFADAAPSVRLFDRSYQPARSWRGNLSWGSAFKTLSYSVDAIFSLNLNQPSTTDLNFAGVSRFTLANEGGRAVFVPPSSVIPSTGALTLTSARREAEYGSVLSRTSDLRGWARQVSVRMRPLAGTGTIFGQLLLDGTYTFTQVRSQSRGFDGAAFGDPRDVSWARGDYAPTHEFFLQAGHQGRLYVVSLAGKVSSGLPYTPVVGSDVNADGFANDRAFVFGSNASDPAVAQAMQKLVASTSGSARDCLRRQTGAVAARNSCEGPWFATLNMTLAPGFGVMRKLRASHVSNVALNLTNPLAGVDRLLYGDNLHGWGQPATPDRVLYYVRGFDSLTHQFRYEVNPRFGDTRPRSNALRSPFRLTLDVSLDFSRNGEEQQLDRILNPGRRGNPGIKLDSAAIIKRYCGNLPDWYREVVAEADSLLLTRDQVEALQNAKAEYSRSIMAHWGTWSSELANLPDRWDVSDLVKRQNKLINDAWEIARQEAQRTLPTILSPVQLKLLPGNSRFLFNAKEPITQVRFFSTAAC
jgi:hypothetical protein